MGANYFTENPTVPRDSIVGQVNIDMIGRGSAADTPGGGPGYVQLIGSRRLSSQLGELVEAEGKKGSPAFRYDYQYDANGHPSQYYCRSDHYMYARFGIPVVFLSTGGHPSTPDHGRAAILDYDQLARVTSWCSTPRSRSRTSISDWWWTSRSGSEGNCFNRQNEERRMKNADRMFFIFHSAFFILLYQPFRSRSAVICAVWCFPCHAYSASSESSGIGASHSG